MSERAPSISGRGVWQRGVVVSTVALLCLCLGTSAVSAQTAKPKLSPEDQQKVLGLLRSAKAAYKKESWAESLKLYKEAYALYPAASLLFRMGELNEKLGKPREAVREYERFVKAAKPDDPTAMKVKLDLPKLKAKVPALVIIKTDPVGANVYINSLATKPIGSTPLRKEFGPGKHLFIIKLDGYDPITRTFTFEGSEEVTIEEKLKLLPPDQRPKTAGPTSSVNVMKVAGWSLTGLGVAGLATGGVFSLLQAGKTSDANDYDKRAAGASPAALQQLKDEAEQHYKTSLIFYIAGGVATAAGVGVLLLSGDSADKGEKKVKVSDVRMSFGAAPGGAAVGLSGSF